ncbi:MAG: 2-dehydro-3-deoxy-6-phosphogalactonate aldolase [Sneathiellales bacterium]|nr:2-dehydro-3-deoxy-6-phosphogalactonate aldolase [Sneathiellales bacterium]
MNTIFEKIGEMPLVAILRGISPDEVDAVSDILVEKGFTFLEVPLNSPEWQESLKRLSRRHGDTIVLGAGTVLDADDVAKVRDAGGRAIISPNLNEAVVRKTKELGLLAVPGCYTPSECFNALSYGADILKIFPADTLGIPFIKGISAVLPQGTKICPTGGLDTDNIAEFLNAGVFAMGLGSALYKPGKQLSEIDQDAERFIAALRRAG